MNRLAATAKARILISKDVELKDEAETPPDEGYDDLAVCLARRGTLEALTNGRIEKGLQLVQEALALANEQGMERLAQGLQLAVDQIREMGMN